MRPISGVTLVAGVVGRPVAHSLSPLIHNAWIEAAGLDAVYVAFSPSVESFPAFVNGLRGGAVRGLNITAPFKEQALAATDHPTPRAKAAGAANLLVFQPDGGITADNTDGVGLLAAFAAQAPGFDPAAGPVVLIGAGGAARGAAAAFIEFGAPAITIVNRSEAGARRLVELLGPKARVASLADALPDANAIINATPGSPDVPLETALASAVVMDMVYRPLITPFLARASARGLRTVDGLAMLIGQAGPSFHALFGRPPPMADVRALALEFVEAAR